MIMVGFLVGIFIATRRARKANLDPNNILDLGIYLVVAGVLGARLFFIIQFRQKFGFAILNIFDGNFSIIGLVLGLAGGAALYFRRMKFNFLKRFHESTLNTKLFFGVLAVLFALVLGRALYIFLTPSSTMILAVNRDKSDFYPDSFKRELVNKYDQRITRITGRVSAPGENFGKETVYAYEFLPAHERTGPHGYTYDDAQRWLSDHGVVSDEVRPAYDLMLFEIWKGGLVYYGGLLGAIAAAVFFAHKRKIHFWKLTDICAVSAAAGLACGRIGCFLNGCCWGKVTETFPLAITFPQGSPAFSQHVAQGLIHSNAAHSLPVYPTQLMHFMAAILLAVVIWLFGRSRLKKNYGEEVLLLGIIYPWLRFTVEFLRGDNEPSYLFGSLTISQSVGVFVFVAATAVFAIRRIKGYGRIEPSGAVEKDDEPAKVK